MQPSTSASQGIRISRRVVLKRGLLAGLGLASASLLAACQPAAPAPASKQEPAKPAEAAKEPAKATK